MPVRRWPAAAGRQGALHERQIAAILLGYGLEEHHAAARGVLPLSLTRPDDTSPHGTTSLDQKRRLRDRGVGTLAPLRRGAPARRTGVGTAPRTGRPPRAGPRGYRAPGPGRRR